MRTFEKREDPIRLMQRRIIILILLLLVFVAVRGVWGVYQKERDSRALRHEAEAQLSELKARETDLRHDLTALKSERGIEEVLREEYELAREGEGVIVIVDNNDPEAPEPPPTSFQRFEKLLRWW